MAETFSLLLVENGFLRTPAFLRLYDSFEQAAKALDISLTRLTNDALCPLPDLVTAPDAVLFWDKDVRLAAQLERQGLAVFNSSESIAVCDDKTLTWLCLKDSVPMPETILAPMAYGQYADTGFLRRVEEQLGFPYILKEGIGSFGQQVYLIRSREEAVIRLKTAGERPVLFQRFIREAEGTDKRIYVVGDRCVAAMIRRAPPGDFRSNIGNGGTAEPCEVTDEEAWLALQTAKELDLVFAGIDILPSEQGPLICEVNSNAHFSALSQLTGVDIASAILQEIVRQKLMFFDNTDSIPF